MLFSSVIALYTPEGSRSPWHMANQTFIKQTGKGLGTHSVILVIDVKFLINVAETGIGI